MTAVETVERAGLARVAWLLRLVRVQARVQLRAACRSPEFIIAAVGIPVILYAMFGLPVAQETLPAGTTVGAMLVVSFSAYGVVSVALFTFGDELAKERGRGWIRTLRATPTPTWVHLGGKLLTATLYAVLIVAAIGVVAVTAGGVRLDPQAWLRLVVTMVTGVVAFSTVGFALAYLIRPRAASAVAQLLFLPLSFASGFFFPLQDLPDFLGRLAPYLPTYHFGQLAWQQAAPVVDVEAFVGVAPASTTVHVSWVAGSFLVFGVAALLGARREGVSRRG